MLNKKNFFITLVITLSITNTNALSTEEVEEPIKFVQKEKDNKFLPYLLNPDLSEEEILSLIKKDVKDISGIDSKSENIEDALLELNQGNKTQEIIEKFQIDCFNKLKALVYMISRNMEKKYPPKIFQDRFFILFHVFSKIEISDDLKKKNLISELFHFFGKEKNWVDHFNPSINIDDPKDNEDEVVLQFNNCVRWAIILLGNLNELNQEHFTYLFPNINLFKPDELILFFENIYKSKLYIKRNFSISLSLMIIETLLYHLNKNKELPEITDNKKLIEPTSSTISIPNMLFTINIDSILKIKNQMFSNNSINFLLLMSNSLDDMIFQSVFYETLIDFRLKNENYLDYSEKDEYENFDRYLDYKGENTSDLPKRWILHMKLITILALSTTDKVDYYVTIPRLDENELKDILENKEIQCKSLDRAFIEISSIYDSSVNNFDEAIRFFNTVGSVYIKDVKKKLKNLGFDLKKHKVIDFDMIKKTDKGLSNGDSPDTEEGVLRSGILGIFIIMFLY